MTLALMLSNREKSASNSVFSWMCERGARVAISARCLLATLMALWDLHQLCTEGGTCVHMALSSPRFTQEGIDKDQNTSDTLCTAEP